MFPCFHVPHLHCLSLLIPIPHTTLIHLFLRNSECTHTQRQRPRSTRPTFGATPYTIKRPSTEAGEIAVCLPGAVGEDFLRADEGGSDASGTVGH